MSVNPHYWSEMKLSDVERDKWPALAPAWEKWNEMAATEFQYADESADRQQFWFRFLVCTIASIGALGPILAVIFLWFKKELPAALDVTIGVASGLLVLAIIFLKFQRNWLLNRYRSEAYRISLFRFLIESISAGTLSCKLICQLCRDLLEIRSCRLEDLEQLVRRFPVDKPSPPRPGEINPQTVQQLASAYRDKRIKSQLSFFNLRATSYATIGRFLRLGAILLLVVSVGFSFLGLYLQIKNQADDSQPKQMESVPAAKGKSNTVNDASDPKTTPPITFLLIMGIALPIISGAMRTMSGAWETGRNRLRYEAVRNALLDVELR